MITERIIKKELLGLDNVFCFATIELINLTALLRFCGRWQFLLL